MGLMVKTLIFGTHLIIQYKHPELFPPKANSLPENATSAWCNLLKSFQLSVVYSFYGWTAATVLRYSLRHVQWYCSTFKTQNNAHMYREYCMTLYQRFSENLLCNMTNDVLRIMHVFLTVLNTVQLYYLDYLATTLIQLQQSPPR